MRLIRPITEAEMIAVFLQGEIDSARFGPTVLAGLTADEQARGVVDNPDTGDLEANAYRRRLLASYRAYLFEVLPADLRWHRAALRFDEVARVRYIDYSYWNDLSGGTRLPSAAIYAIREGCEVFGQSNQGFLDAAEALRAGALFPELIVVGESPQARLTVIEGHVRLTAYLLAPECLPAELEVIAGFAPGCAAI